MCIKEKVRVALSPSQQPTSAAMYRPPPFQLVIDCCHKEFLLLVTFYSQTLHVSRQVCATLVFLHFSLLLSSVISFSQEHSLSFPFLMKNTPSASEHSYSEHLPHTLGQCVATCPWSEQVSLSLSFSANLQEKGSRLPPSVFTWN